MDATSSVDGNFLTRYLVRREGRKLWGGVMLCVTLTYLAVEFGFNARLLDVVGGNVSPAAVESIERWGRCLSGFALALALWPSRFHKAEKHSWGIRRLVMSIAILTAVTMTAVFVLEKVAIVDQLVDHSTLEARSEAVNLQLLQQAFISGEIKLDGLKLDVSQPVKPDVKTFMATFPFLVSSIRNIEARIKDQKADIVRRELRDNTGMFDKAWRGYVQSRHDIERRYNAYVSVVNRGTLALNNIDRNVDAQWARYVSKLARYSWTPDTVPNRRWGDVRKFVRKQGLHVADDWVPSDREGFYEAYRQKVESSVGANLNIGNGIRLPRNLTFAQFVARPETQKAWKQALGTPANMTVRLLDSRDDFDAEIYGPMLETRVSDTVKRLNAPAEDFADHGIYEREGRAAYRAVVVPPISLALSLAGALVHILKLAVWIGMMLTGWVYRNAWVLMGALVSFCGGVLGMVGVLPTTSITAEPLFAKVIYPAAQADGRAGPLVAWAVRSTIHLQPIAWPVFENVRVNVLQGFNFGVE
ncbi:hypothetical protein LRK24_10940 [Rhodanobacter denitrificans]|uniref:hypothetical protein n=1 Tax=Rhodanobacter denitrificans TaxID=666685 RepID=UPI000260CC32|nr:hypothetical protein [Rhodanobacter denitrificans]EIM04257.1 hypothetical protein UUC_03515 [Rhodanobacter denitrificans]UJM88971.1 hypothetical protein LRK24_10940 [Rhodanobacter denitrificans]